MPGETSINLINLIKSLTTGGVTTVGQYVKDVPARGYYDINSLYPTVIAKHAMPFGSLTLQILINPYQYNQDYEVNID